MRRTTSSARISPRKVRARVRALSVDAAMVDRAVGWPDGTYALVIAGEYDPRLTEFCRLAACLSVHPHDLLAGKVSPH